MSSKKTLAHQQIGVAKTVPHRHRKIFRDNILGVTRPAIRRLARRGGVIRISAGIYDEVRACILKFLEKILKDVAAILEYNGRKTVLVTDVVFVLNKLGRPIYGFGTTERDTMND